MRRSVLPVPEPHLKIAFQMLENCRAHWGKSPRSRVEPRRAEHSRYPNPGTAPKHSISRESRDSGGSGHPARSPHTVIQSLLLVTTQRCGRKSGSLNPRLRAYCLSIYSHCMLRTKRRNSTQHASLRHHITLYPPLPPADSRPACPPSASPSRRSPIPLALSDTLWGYYTCSSHVGLDAYQATG